MLESHVDTLQNRSPSLPTSYLKHCFEIALGELTAELERLVRRDRLCWRCDRLGFSGCGARSLGRGDGLDHLGGLRLSRR